MIAENGTASGCDSLSRAEHNRHKALHHRGAGNADAAVKNQKRVSENIFRSLTLLLSQADAHAGSSTHTGHIRKGRGAHADSGKSHLARRRASFRMEVFSRSSSVVVFILISRTLGRADKPAIYPPASHFLRFRFTSESCWSSGCTP